MRAALVLLAGLLTLAASLDSTPAAAASPCRPGDALVSVNGRIVCQARVFKECVLGDMRRDYEGDRDVCIYTVVKGGRVYETRGIMRCDTIPGTGEIVQRGPDICLHFYPPRRG